MKYGGNVIIKYKDGKSQILNVPGIDAYQAGELMCQLAQGEEYYHLIKRARVVPKVLYDVDQPITQETVDEAEYTVINYLLDYKEEAPLAAHLATSVFYRIIEKHRTLIGRDISSLEEYIAGRIIEFAQDERAEYICGCDMSSMSSAQRVGCVDKLLNLTSLGGFMMLCYAEYVTDVLDGLNFFQAAAAVETGTATEEEVEITNRLLSELETSEHIHGAEAMIQYDKESGSYSLAYCFSSFLALEVFEYVHMKQAGAKIMRCQNPECGKFFIAQRSTAKFCPYPSPQDPERSCKLLYPQILYKKKKESDEAYRLFRKIQSKLMKRRKSKSAERDKRWEKVNEFTDTYRNIMKPAFDRGEITFQELKAWMEKY